MSSIKAYNTEFNNLRQAAINAGKDVSNFKMTQEQTNAVMANASDNAKNIVASADGAAVSLGNLEVSAKAAKIGLKALAMAENMIIGMVVAEAISKMISVIDDWIHAEEKAEEALQKAQSTSDSYKSSLESTRQEQLKSAESISKLAGQYAQLSEGVNTATNDNISLSNEDYNEFLNLNSQLSDLFPTLTKRYDSNGNAILNLGSNAQSVTQKIKSLADQQERLANLSIIEDLKSYVDGDDDNGGQLFEIKGLSKKYSKQQNELNAYDLFKQMFNGGKVSQNNLGIKQVSEVLKNANLNPTLIGTDSNGFWDISGLSTKDLTALQDAVHSFYKDISTETQAAQDKLQSANSEMSNEMMVWVQQLDQYYNSDHNLQSMISTMVGNIDWDSVGASSFDGAQRYIERYILDPLNQIGNDESLNQDFSKSVASLLTLDV